MDVLPPYLNDSTLAIYEKELLKAKKEEIKAGKNLEAVVEYRKFCEDKVAKRKKDLEK